MESIYDLQVNYGGWEGMPQTVGALNYLRTFGPTVLFPIHQRQPLRHRAGERRLGAPAKVAFGFALELNGKLYGEACHGIGNYIRYPYHG